MANGKSAAAPRRSGAIPDAGPSDGDLLERFNADRGESAEAAFAGLVRRHGPMVLRVCGQILGDRHGAEDAFQATFLVLARRSGSIRRPELLGNWLHGVALRTAREARMREGRRRRLEAPSAEGARDEPVGDAGRPDAALISREAFEALHEELSRLPDRFRIPVILCELEGLTYREVARRMHCPVSTVGVRLVRAREQLRKRMIRRGIVPAAGLTGAIFGAEGASASMPWTLVDATARAAAGFAAGGDAAASAATSAAVVALSRAVLKAMAAARIKAASGLVMVVGLAAAVGWLGAARTARPPVAAARPIHAARPAPGPALTAPMAAVPPGPGVIVRVAHREEAAPRILPALAVARRPVREELARGEVLFFKEWAANDPAAPRGDGLGPVFNEGSCVACHGLGAPGGAGPEGKNVVILTAVATPDSRRLSRNLARIHPGFGASRSTVLHRYGTDPAYATWRRQLLDTPGPKAQGAAPEGVEEKVEDRIRRIAAGVMPGGSARGRSPRLNPAPGIALNVSERNTPALFGAGRIDAIPAEVLVRQAADQPDEVRGRVGRDREGRVGRFGWKAQTADLHEFVRVACAGELGLEVPGHAQSASPLAPSETARGLDLSQDDCDALVAYVRSLPSPLAVDPYGPQGTRDMGEGRRIFAEVGCATCHAPSLGEVRGIYGDLLLHDMGQGLSDTGEYYGFDGFESPGAPGPNEWRTPPLWGFRDSGPYLHDGRAETLEEAVALHGGQGTGAARRFFALTPEERSWVESFLKSLVAPASASAPGLLLAAELESRIEPDEVRQAEALVRRQREEARDLELQRKEEARRRQAAAAAAKLAPGRLVMAENLEKAGRIAGAVEFYSRILKEVPNTEEGRSAAARIALLRARPKSP